MIQKIPFLVGFASIQSDLSIDEVGKILSDKLFGGLKFGGKDLAIHEEIPAIFIQVPILGLQIVLDGYSGLGENSFNLSIGPWNDIFGVEFEDIRLDNYLNELLRIYLKDIDVITLME